MIDFDYVKEHVSRYPLFKTRPNQPFTAVLDRRGFFMHEDTVAPYCQIRDTAHLYFAWDEAETGIYIGRSNQLRGRFQRGHYYHLGTLGHEVLGTRNPNEPSYAHWVEAWFEAETLQIGEVQHSLQLRSTVFVAFVPFEGVHALFNINPQLLLKDIESATIQFNGYRNLLNIMGNN